MRIVLAAALALLAAVGVAAAQQLAGPCDDSKLPAGVRAALSQGYTDWKVLDVSGLDPDFRAAWNERHPKDCPGIAIGHFENKTDLSYAVLVIPKDPARSAYQLFVLSKTGDRESYSARKLEGSDAYAADGLAISRVPPGTYFNLEKGSNYTLSLDGIFFEFFEKGAVVFHWNGKRYISVPQSD